MITVAWNQLILGLVIIAFGGVTVVRSRPGARTVILLGLLNSSCAASILVWYSGNDLGGIVMAGYAIVLILLLSVFVPRSWQLVRSVVIFGTATCLGLVGLLFAEAGSSTQAALVIVVTLTAATFLAISLVRIFRLVRDAAVTSV